MAEFTLVARPALGGYAREWNGAALVEVERTLVSAAARAGKAPELFGAPLPGPGRFVEAEGVTAVWTGPEQWMLMAEDAGLPGRLRDAWGGAVSLTEQTDGWALLRLSGPAAMAGLERFCPLDLGAFPAGSAARTAMEHVGAVILREDDAPTFLLMTARSSARSFLHGLETALESALG